MNLWKCPWCSSRSWSMRSIKEHIHKAHETIDHWALWVNNSDRQ